MGRPPTNGGPSFRFSAFEVGEMEAILKSNNYTVPAREVLDALAHKFSISTDRAGKVEISAKQIWNWFQNRRYAVRAKAARDQAIVIPQVPTQQPQGAPQSRVLLPRAPQTHSSTVISVPHPASAPSSAQIAVRNVSENMQMEFEAKSSRDGAWYDVTAFLSHRSLETGDPDALVRFAGFGSEEDEWVNIRRHVRQRSLPCESAECVAVLPGDLILCFQEGKEQALYFDAHILDAQRRRHDVRGCRCRFLARYDHDQSEEIVPLRKICRRPETDYRLQQLHAVSVNVKDSLKSSGSFGTAQKQEVQVENDDVTDTTGGSNPAAQQG